LLGMPNGMPDALVILRWSAMEGVGQRWRVLSDEIRAGVVEHVATTAGAVGKLLGAALQAGQIERLVALGIVCDVLWTREVADPASLVVVFAIFSTFLFMAQPVVNRIIYAGEVEADIYALNASREPHGFSTVAMRLGSYRKLEPGPIETILFYDHPSGRERVRMSMEWLAENQQLFVGKE